MNDIPISDIVTFLKTDLKPVMDILEQPNVVEVMLNPYEKMNGDYEGHIWYDAHGVGMKQLILQQQIQLSTYPQVEIGDYVLIKRNNEQIINWMLVNDNTETFYKSLKQCLCYTLHQDVNNNYFLEQEEFYWLNEFGLYLSKGFFNFKDPINDDLSVDGIIETINATIKKKHILFNLEFVEVTVDLLTKLVVPKYCIKKEFQKINSITAEQMIGVLASANDKKAHKYEPIVEVQIPFYGHRFTAVLPPSSKFPFFTIRKHAAQIKTLEDYVNEGVMPQSAADILAEWIKRRYNILVCGSVGSGKTTLLNTCLDLSNKYTPNDRVGIMEDTPEIKNVIANSYAIATAEGVSFSKLLKTSLRLSANRLVVGEIRGAEAYILLKAMTGGFRGCMGTIHADGAKHALSRFEQCLSENEEVGKIQPVHRIQIAGGINGIASIQKVTVTQEVNGILHTVTKRKLTSLLRIKGFDPKYNLYEDTFLYKDPESFLLTNDGLDINDADDFADFINKKQSGDEL